MPPANTYTLAHMHTDCTLHACMLYSGSIKPLVARCCQYTNSESQGDGRETLISIIL